MELDGPGSSSNLNKNFWRNDIRKETIKNRTFHIWINELDLDKRKNFIGQILEGFDEKTLRIFSVFVDHQLRKVSSNTDPLNALPRHLVIKILSYLDPRKILHESFKLSLGSLCLCMCVCKIWYESCNDPSVWKKLCYRPRDYRMSSTEAECLQIQRNTLLDGTILWKRTFSERYRLWRNWNTGRCVIRTFNGHTQGITCVQFDLNRIVSGSSDSTIRIWDIKTNVNSVGSMTLTGHSATVRCLHLDKNRLASGSNDYNIKIWDLTVNPSWSHIACRKTLLGHTNSVRCLQMEEEKVLSGSYDHTLKIWSIDTGYCIRTLLGHTDSVLCLQYGRNQSLLISGSSDNTIRLWDERTSQCAMTLHNAHEAHVTCLRFDSERIISGSVDRTIKIWDIRTGRCNQTIDWKLAEGHTGVVRCLQTDSWRIVSAADDKTIKVWKLDSGERLCTLQQHTDGVTAIAFDDHKIVSGSYDQTVKLWDFSIC